jgi:hypothetical protein
LILSSLIESYTPEADTMSNSNKTQSIPQALWDCHKQTIERLYVKEGKRLESSDGVIEFMGKHHNFHATYVYHCINIHKLMPASKSQYETQFRKWRLRKNLTKLEWKRIIRYLNQNTLDLEHREIVFQGVVLSKDRVLREIARHGSINEQEGTLMQHLR